MGGTMAAWVMGLRAVRQCVCVRACACIVMAGRACA